MERIAIKIGDIVCFHYQGKQFKYEVKSDYLNGLGCSNDAIFKELKIDKYSFCDDIYGYSCYESGIWPEYHYDDMVAAAKVIEALSKYCAYITINGVMYPAEKAKEVYIENGVKFKILDSTYFSNFAPKIEALGFKNSRGYSFNSKTSYYYIYNDDVAMAPDNSEFLDITKIINVPNVVLCRNSYKNLSSVKSEQREQKESSTTIEQTGTNTTADKSIATSTIEVSKEITLHLNKKHYSF